MRTFLLGIVFLLALGGMGLGMHKTISHGWSFAALQQDQWVLHALGHKKGGYFVDARGRSTASSSSWQSNTFLLEHWYQWTGVCLHVGEEGDTPGRTWNWFSSQRTCYQDSIHVGATPAQTLVGVLREALAPRVIDYLSIDAENNGALLLLDFPFNEYEFSIIHIDIGPDNERRQALRAKLMDNGYLIAMAPHDHVWYVNSGTCRLTYRIPEGFKVSEDASKNMEKGTWTADCTAGSQSSLSQEE